MNDLLYEQFGFRSPEIRRLTGYDNANYLIEHQATTYILKTYQHNDELLAILEAENELLLHLQQTGGDGFPKPIPAKNGHYIGLATINGKETIYHGAWLPRQYTAVNGHQRL